MIPKLRNWVLHDYLQVNGGAERLVINLARGLSGFGLGVSGIYQNFVSSGELGEMHCQITAGVLTRCLPRIPRALIAFSLSKSLIRHADRVIYSGIYAPLAVRHQLTGKRIYYCHTPPRFAFDREEEYLERSIPLFRPFLRIMIAQYRKAYLNALKHMDLIIANSNHVSKRLYDLTGMDSKVIYPPILTKHFSHRGEGGYYLSVGRLEKPKRVDRIVRAFLSMPDCNLVVASGGSEFDRLNRIAKGAANIHFTNWINDNDLADLVGRAIAVIYIPSDEDFGMSAVEAMAAGRPVIGVAEGGLVETIVDGQTGIMLSPNPSPAAIASAVKQLTEETAIQMRESCIHRAGLFSTEQFLSSFKSIIE